MVQTAEFVFCSRVCSSYLHWRIWVMLAVKRLLRPHVSLTGTSKKDLIVLFTAFTWTLWKVCPFTGYLPLIREQVKEFFHLQDAGHGLNFSPCLKADAEPWSDATAEQRRLELVCLISCNYVCVLLWAASRSTSSCTIYGCQQTVGLCNPGDRQLLCIRFCWSVPLPAIQHTHRWLWSCSLTNAHNHWLFICVCERSEGEDVWQIGE